jgi:succinate dehydrogenase hydrophobic anchor subunit
MPEKLKFKDGAVIVIGIIFLVALTFLTTYFGSTDVADYSDTAKYFAGKLSSDIRNSHSYVYGFMHYPFVKFMDNFLSFKITGLICLLLIIFSVYIVTKNKKALYLILFSPAVWYMAPWINPIQLASLLFIWAYFSIRTYENSGKLKYLALSGFLIGLAWCFWDTILFIGLFLVVSFMYNKKLSHFALIFLFILIGLFPRFILDTYLFGFPFYSMLKSTMGTIANIFGGIYQKSILSQATSYASSGLIAILPVLLAVPLFFWKLYNPKIFIKEKKTMIFLTLSLILFLINPQIRYILVIIPIMVIVLAKNISEKQFKFQLILSILIILFFVSPYILQIKYSISDNPLGSEITNLFESKFKFILNQTFPSQEMESNLNSIADLYPNQTFIVGIRPDDFQNLAHFYWGNQINEFVSIQDYEMYIKNETTLFQKTLMPAPRINDRRQIWISGGMSINANDKTDYGNITLAIGYLEPVNLQNFRLVNQFGNLYLSKKFSYSE